MPDRHARTLVQIFTACRRYLYAIEATGAGSATERDDMLIAEMLCVLLITGELTRPRMCAETSRAVRSPPNLDRNSEGQGRAVSGVSERER